MRGCKLSIFELIIACYKKAIYSVTSRIALENILRYDNEPINVPK